MHHLHHQKYGHPDSEVCHSCCQGSQVGAPGIVWALAARAPPINITDMITASTKSLTLRIHPSSSYRAIISLYVLLGGLSALSDKPLISNVPETLPALLESSFLGNPYAAGRILIQSEGIR